MPYLSKIGVQVLHDSPAIVNHSLLSRKLRLLTEFSFARTARILFRFATKETQKLAHNYSLLTIHCQLLISVAHRAVRVFFAKFVVD